MHVVFARLDQVHSRPNVGSLIYQLIGAGDTAAKTAPHEDVTSSV